MPSKNFHRLIQLADEVFAYKSDPDQLVVDEQVMEKLHRLHPSTLSEFADDEGPVAWVLLFPTTSPLMEEFLAGTINEKELLARTPVDTPYDALYLCSALVLEEYRKKGITKRLVMKAIEDIRRDHPLQTLFVWSFTKEGDVAAERIAAASGLPLRKK